MKQSELKKHGKKSALWRKVRAKWVQQNPSNHEGQYVCALCGKAVHIDDVEIDHIISRSSSPESFADLANLQPTHHTCNSNKGSRKVESLITPEEYELRRLLNL